MVPPGVCPECLAWMEAWTSHSSEERELWALCCGPGVGGIMIKAQDHGLH